MSRRKFAISVARSYSGRDVVERIQKLVWEAPTPTRNEKVPVYDLAQVS